MSESNNSDGSHVGPSSSRSQALASGAVVDLSSSAAKLGIDLPVACDARTFRRYLVPNHAQLAMGETMENRVLSLLRNLQTRIADARVRGLSTSHLNVHVTVAVSHGAKRNILLIAVCGPDEMGTTAITILTPANLRLHSVTPILIQERVQAMPAWRGAVRSRAPF